jgi:hypothetical protein
MHRDIVRSSANFADLLNGYTDLHASIKDYAAHWLPETETNTSDERYSQTCRSDHGPCIILSLNGGSQGYKLWLVVTKNKQE